MATLNKVFLIGYLGSDPESIQTSSGKSMCKLSMATTEKWGEGQEQTDWHRVICWGKQAELCQQYLSKGSQVHIEGRIQYRSWEDNEGNTKWTTEIVAFRVTFLGKGGGGSRRQNEPPPPSEPPGGGSDNFDDDDIPF